MALWRTLLIVVFLQGTPRECTLYALGLRGEKRLPWHRATFGGTWMALYLTMDASDLFSMSARQPARMPPDIRELPPLTRRRSSVLPDRSGSPSGSQQSRRRSAGCGMRTVKEERPQRDLDLVPEGSATHAQQQNQSAEIPGSPSGAARRDRASSSTRERSGRNQEAQTPVSGSSSRRSSCSA